MFKFAVAILAAVALIGAVGVTAQCTGTDLSVSTPGTPMSVSWAFASGELTGTVTTAADKKAATAQTVTISCTGADLTCTNTGDITGCSFDYNEIDGCVTADTSATLTGYDAVRQYVLTGTLTWTETYSFCRAAGTAPVTGDRSQEQPFQVTVTVPTQDTATTGSIEVHDTWNTGLGVTSVTVTRDPTDATMGTLAYNFVASVQYPYEVESVSIGGGAPNSGTGSCAGTGVCTRNFAVIGVAAGCDQSGSPLINSVTFTMTIGCSTGGASDCPFQTADTPTVDATVSITVGSFCVQTVDGSFTLTLTSHHPATASTCEVAAQDDFYYDDTAGAADSICLMASVTNAGAANNFGVTSVGFNTIKVSAGTTTVTGSGTGTTSAEQVVGTKDFGTDLPQPAVDSSTSVTLEAVVDVGYGGGSKRRGLLSVASQTLTHTVSLSRGTAGNGAAAAATADNSLVTATSTTSSASTIAIIVGAVAVVSLVAVIAGVAVRRNNQQNAKSVAAMEAALRKANDTAAPKEEVEAASASTTAADSAVSASSSSGEYYYYSYTTASSSV